MVCVGGVWNWNQLSSLRNLYKLEANPVFDCVATFFMLDQTPLGFGDQSISLHVIFSATDVYFITLKYLLHFCIYTAIDGDNIITAKVHLFNSLTDKITEFWDV